MAFVTMSSGSLAAYCKVLERNYCSSRRDVKASSTEWIELCYNLKFLQKEYCKQVVVLRNKIRSSSDFSLETVI